jgi:hypothetical protein
VKRRGYFEELELNWSIILKCFLKELDVGMEI